MSLLRSYKQAIPRRLLPACPTYTRHFSAESQSQPVRAGDAPQKETTQITEVAHTDVLTAEVISGAPGVFPPTDTENAMFNDRQSSGAPASHGTDLSTSPQHHAKRSRKVRAVAH